MEKIDLFDNKIFMIDYLRRFALKKILMKMSPKIPYILNE